MNKYWQLIFFSILMVILDIFAVIGLKRAKTIYITTLINFTIAQLLWVGCVLRFFEVI